MALYVYSTLACDNDYTGYSDGGADLPVKSHSVLIKGGAGVANDRLITPRGVATEITESDAEFLRANFVFKMHEKNGFVKISESKMDADKAAHDMEARDNSAPVIAADLGSNDRPTLEESKDEDDRPRKGKKR